MAAAYSAGILSDGLGCICVSCTKITEMGAMSKEGVTMSKRVRSAKKEIKIMEAALHYEYAQFVQ